MLDALTLEYYKKELRAHGRVLIHVHIMPGTSISKVKEILTQSIDGLVVTLWRIQVRSIPEDGKANQDLRKLLSTLFDLKENNVIILRGEHARYKLVQIQI